MAIVQYSQLGALILAGGLGSRMGYQNKGLIKFGKYHLIDPVLSILKQHCAYVAISANQDVEQYSNKNVDVWVDQIPWKGLGPLAGVNSSVPYFPENIQYIQVVPCDSPFINSNVIQKLFEKLKASDVLAVYAQTSSQIYPVIFQFKRAALIQLSEYLMASNKHSIRRWLSEIGAIAVNFEDDDIFINMNDMQTLNQYLPMREKLCH
jgi:molybdenum cofactor guanylyltransferase